MKNSKPPPPPQQQGKAGTIKSEESDVDQEEYIDK